MSEGSIHWSFKLGPFSAELYMGPPRDDVLTEDEEREPE